MTTLGIGILVSTIVLLMIFGKSSGSGIKWRTKFSKMRISPWFTFGVVVRWTIFLFVLYMVIGLGYEGRYFWQDREYTSRFQMIEDTRMIAYIIPEIAPEYQNKIVITQSFGVVFSEGDEMELFFIGAKLIQTKEGTGESLGRRFSNFIFSQDKKEPRAVYEDSIRGDERSPTNVIILRRGDEIIFSQRGENRIYILGGRLGDQPHLNFHLCEMVL